MGINLREDPVKATLAQERGGHYSREVGRDSGSEVSSGRKQGRQMGSSRKDSLAVSRVSFLPHIAPAI